MQFLGDFHGDPPRTTGASTQPASCLPFAYYAQPIVIFEQALSLPCAIAGILRKLAMTAGCPEAAHTCGGRSTYQTDGKISSRTHAVPQFRDNSNACAMARWARII